jgi:hypothetical protein
LRRGAFFVESIDLTGFAGFPQNAAFSTEVVDNSVDNVENSPLKTGKTLWIMWIKLWITVDKPVDICGNSVDEV